ncbi:NifB/NifX family molybdenum-iron cluster-binding protein [Geomonas edaphica]|uniref:NifB/NifX family molybdenum-iron cluster-binding protein n=1 Tax=Geomonas edaphica TaxID=2570226 RepID=UPI0010A90221|nr:NifB/NifX family molybdenum-iron cluster-binding protein [Geomonas edaphica]
MVKVAVATTDGLTINEHFGQAREFRLYRVEEDGSYELFEVRPIANAPRDNARVHTAETTVEQLADVNVVLVSQIGPHAAGSLARRGIKSFTVKGGIDRALSAYGKRHKLLDLESAGGTGCRPRGGSCGCSQRGGK